jgi:hypothetical protein
VRYSPQFEEIYFKIKRNNGAERKAANNGSIFKKTNNCATVKNDGIFCLPFLNFYALLNILQNSEEDVQYGSNKLTLS